jgi:NCS1 family nucleobase:cation symporter-1
MEQPANFEWQTRVLKDHELTQLLSSKSALESMEILSKQVELRQRDHLTANQQPTPQLVSAPAVPAVEVSPAFDPVLSESSSAIPVVDVESPATSAPVFAAPVVPVVPAPAAADDIAANLNALFAGSAAPVPASLAPVSSAPVAPATITPSEPANELAEATQAEAPTPAHPFQAVQHPFQPAQPVVHPAVPSRDDFEEAIAVEAPPTGSVPLGTIDAGSEPDLISPFEALAPEVADIPSVEETVTEFEETHQEEALPGLVDEIIKSVGGVDDEELPTLQIGATATQAESAKSVGSAEATPSGSKTSNARSLLATWNGTGALLLMASFGYVSALGHSSLASLLAGSFVAMALTGFGFAAAALAARRGHQPQSVLSRAAFGVNGAIIPLVPVLVARLAGTAVLALFAVAGLNWFFVGVPASVSVPVGAQGMQVGTGYLVAVGVLVLGWLATLFGKKTTAWILRILASVMVAGSVAFTAFAYVSHPDAFAIDGNIDFASALGTASLITAMVGMLWGTSASDENPDLQSTTMVPKLLAAGLLNFTVLGSLAAVAGYSFYQLKTDSITSLPMGIAFGVIVIFAFANLIRRNGDSLAGLGVAKTGLGWRTLALVVVAALSLFFVWKLSGDVAWSMFTGYLTFVGVPVLSWLTMFGVDSVLRTTQYHEVSLVRSYGFYGRFNLANLIGWGVATGIGWGFVTIDLPEFAWSGYLAKLVGIAPLAMSANLGVWIAMGISVLVPIAFTIPRIRNQEAEVLALEARRTELLDVLGISE